MKSLVNKHQIFSSGCTGFSFFLNEAKIIILMLFSTFTVNILYLLTKIPEANRRERSFLCNVPLFGCVAKTFFTGILINYI